jgi:ribosomal protein S18 acetylase RimI-like enzyme
LHRVSPDQSALLQNIAPDVFDAAVDTTRLERYLHTPGHLLMVAIADGLVVGQIAGHVHLHIDAEPDLYVDNLGVAPAWQRQGIARRLLEGLRDWGRGHGCAQVWIVTETDNLPAQSLYRSSGLAQTDVVMFSRHG